MEWKITTTYRTTLAWLLTHMRKLRLRIVFYKKDIVLARSLNRNMPLLHENCVSIKYTLSFRGVYRRYIKLENGKYALIDTLQLNKNDMKRIMRMYELDIAKTGKIFMGEV